MHHPPGDGSILSVTLGQHPQPVKVHIRRWWHQNERVELNHWIDWQELRQNAVGAIPRTAGGACRSSQRALHKPASMQSKQVNKKISKHASVKCEPSTPQGAALIMVSRMRRSRHHAGSGGGVNTNAALCEGMTRTDSQSLGPLRCPRRSTQGTVPTVLYSLVVIPPTRLWRFSKT